MYRIQRVLAVMVIVLTLHRSSADFSCNFGARRTKAGLYECGIVQSGPKTWGTVSGFGSNGRAPSGGTRDGFLITVIKKMQNQAIFQLPNLSLPQNSGLLAFHYKFFNPGKSTLAISVCGLISVVTPTSSGNWEMVEGIRVYCNGQSPRVQFTAVWSESSGRIAMDNILVVSTPPPTTTTKVTVTLKSKSTMKRSTPTAKDMATLVTTSEWTASPAQSTGSLSTISGTTEITFNELLVPIPTRLEAKRRLTTVVAVSMSVVIVVLVLIVLAVVFKRRKSGRSSEVKSEGQIVSMSRSLDYNQENDDGNDYETALSNAYVTLPEGVTPVQPNGQASDGDGGTEEMVVNILYQSVDI